LRTGVTRSSARLIVTPLLRNESSRMHGQACYDPALQFSVGDVATLVFKIR
jgi:hypothetical protein